MRKEQRPIRRKSCGWLFVKTGDSGTRTPEVLLVARLPGPNDDVCSERARSSDSGDRELGLQRSWFNRDGKLDVSLTRQPNLG